MEQDFTEAQAEQFEEIRQIGACNMLDRQCVAESAERMAMDDLYEVTSDRRRYSKFLVWFAQIRKDEN